MRMIMGIEQVIFNFVLSFLGYSREENKKMGKLSHRKSFFSLLLVILMYAKASQEQCPSSGFTCLSVSRI